MIGLELDSGVIMDNYTDVCTLTQKDAMTRYEKALLYNDIKKSSEELEKENKLQEKERIKSQNKRLRQMIKKVIFSNDRTIVLFDDGTKVIVQCQPEDEFDKEKGLAVACMKKLFENTNVFNDVMRKWCND